MPQPVLAVAYLLALRAGLVGPSFVPLLVLSMFPVASALVGVSRARRPGRVGLLGVAALELLGTVLGEAIVGFAIAGQSG